MLLSVAGNRPYDVFALLDEPLWRVLYVHHHLTAQRERDAVASRAARVDSGFMSALAFNEPAALEVEMQSVQAAIAELDTPSAGPAGWDAARARAEEMARRMEQGRVLSPEALLS